MADNEGWQIAIGGLSEVADYYLKSKSLDMAQSQFMLQQSNRIVDQEIKVREQQEQRQWQQLMFELQDEARVEAALALRDFQSGQADLQRQASKTAQTIQVLLGEKSNLEADRRVEEKDLRKRHAGLQPEYNTAAYDKITESLNLAKDDLAGRLERQIGREQLKAQQLEIGMDELYDQGAQYRSMLSEPGGLERWAGLDQIVMPHELRKMESVTLKNLGDADRAEWFTKSGTSLPGMTAAWNEEATPFQREQTMRLRHAQMNKEMDAKAQAQYETILLAIKGNVAFVDKGKVEGLGISEVLWKKAFPNYGWKKAMQVFSNTKWEDFMVTYNTSPKLRKDLLGQKSKIGENLKHLEYWANRKQNLGRERAGLEAVLYAGAIDLDVMTTKLTALNAAGATKKEIFRWYKTNVPVTTNKETQDAIFEEITAIFLAKGDKGDIGKEFVDWWKAEPDYTPPEGDTEDFSKKSFYEGEQFKYSKDIKRLWKSMPSEMQGALMMIPQRDVNQYLEDHKFKEFVKKYNATLNARGKSSLTSAEFKAVLERQRFWDGIYTEEPLPITSQKSKKQFYYDPYGEE